SGRSDYWIQIALRGNIQVGTGSGVIDCGLKRAALTSPKHEPVVRSGPGSARFHVSLTETALVRQLAALLGEPIAAPLEFASEMLLAQGYGRSLLEAFRIAAADVEHEGGLLASPFTLASF